MLSVSTIISVKIICLRVQKVIFLNKRTFGRVNPVGDVYERVHKDVSLNTLGDFLQDVSPPLRKMRVWPWNPHVTDPPRLQQEATTKERTVNRSIKVTTRSYNKRDNCEPSNRELAERLKNDLRIRSFDTACERNCDNGDDNSRKLLDLAICLWKIRLKEFLNF